MSFSNFLPKNIYARLLQFKVHPLGCIGLVQVQQITRVALSVLSESGFAQAGTDLIVRTSLLEGS